MAVLGAGSKISANDGASNAQAEFTDVLKITIPSDEVAKLANPHLGVTGNVIQQAPGLATPGEVSVELRFTGSLLARLEALKATPKTWIVTSPDENETTAGGTKAITFDGFVTKYETGFELEAYSNITFVVATACCRLLTS